MAALVPALGQGISRNASSPQGLDDLVGALARGNHGRYLDEPAVVADTAAVDEGNHILGHVFGDGFVRRLDRLRLRLRPAATTPARLFLFFLFGFGLLTVMTRKNAVGILLGVELILNAAALNFIAFEHFVVGGVGGQIFTVFIIVLAAAEAAVALAIVLAMFRNFGTVHVDTINRLKR